MHNRGNFASVVPFSLLLLVTAIAFPVTARVYAQQLTIPGGAVPGPALAPNIAARLEKLQGDLATAKTANDAVGEAKALNLIGGLYYGIALFPKAIETYNDALASARSAKDAAQQISALFGIATCYQDLGQADKAQPWFQQEFDLAIASANLFGQVTALNGLAHDDYMKGQFQPALDLYSKALEAAKKAASPQLIASVLGGSSLVYSGLGQPQKAIDNDKEALQAFRQLGNRIGEAETLNNIGIASSGLGNLQDGLDQFTQARQIFHDLGQRGEEARTLNNMGLNYAWLGNVPKALEAYEEALRLRKEVGDRRGVGITLGNMGLAYYDIGEIEKALEYYNQALVIRREFGNPDQEAQTLINVGNALAALGKYQKALEAHSEALALFRKAGDRDGEAIVLQDMGAANNDMGNPKGALDLLQQSLPIAREVGDRDNEAQSLSALADAWSALGDQPKAIDAYNQSLTILRDVGDRATEASTLDNIGVAWSKFNQKEKAADAYGQALPIAVEVNDPLLQARIFYDMLLLQRDSQPTLAIFYGKESLNRLQQVRRNMQGLDKSLQKSFIASKDDYYHDLADLLIDHGRLPEAQEVLDLLKQQEYSDYVRGDAANNMNLLALTPSEKQAEDDYAESSGQIVALGEQWSALKKIDARTPEQEKQFQQLTQQLNAASKSLNDYYTRLYGLFGSSGSANKQVADVKGAVSLLKQTIGKMPHTVALYTMVGSERYSVIFVTGPTAVAREYTISEKDLNQKVSALQQALRDRHSDVKPIAAELYKILIGPVQADLDQAKAETLVWSLDGVLRYVPVAALYDGRKFVVEKYNTVTITPASIPHLAERPDFSNMRAAAMGISRQYEESLPALPAVVGELDDVVIDARRKDGLGVMPGTILLDGAFTEKGMENALNSPHTVVHIASHFVFRPGDDSQSYLLLAGKDQDASGYHMTVAGFRDDQNLSLDDTDLLTLSACETGMSGSANDGREVDGLGTTAQLKGAKAVISSLWEVNDASTGALMADFYKRWTEGDGKVMKVEALRQAQLDLLHDKEMSQVGSSDRGITPEESKHGKQVDLAGYAHPYYWAPFVLMGNWR